MDVQGLLDVKAQNREFQLNGRWRRCQLQWKRLLIPLDALQIRAAALQEGREAVQEQQDRKTYCAHPYERSARPLMHSIWGPIHASISRYRLAAVSSAIPPLLSRCKFATYEQVAYPTLLLLPQSQSLALRDGQPLRATARRACECRFSLKPPP